VVRCIKDLRTFAFCPVGRYFSFNLSSSDRCDDMSIEQTLSQDDHQVCRIRAPKHKANRVTVGLRVRALKNDG
jgi:hypothetical protein